MKTYDLNVQFTFKTSLSSRAKILCRIFGLTKKRLAELKPQHKCKLEIKQGDIVFITGPSGAGKSVLLKELKKQFAPETIADLADIETDTEQLPIDLLTGSVFDAVNVLSTAGLNDTKCFLVPLKNLSDGQKYRFALACAIQTRKKIIFADEFCSNLDSVTALALAYNVRKHATRHDVTFVLASSNFDMINDLQPDIVVRKDFTAEAEVTYQNLQRAQRNRKVKNA